MRAGCAGSGVGKKTFRSEARKSLGIVIDIVPEGLDLSAPQRDPLGVEDWRAARRPNRARVTRASGAAFTLGRYFC